MLGDELRREEHRLSRTRLCVDQSGTVDDISKRPSAAHARVVYYETSSNRPTTISRPLCMSVHANINVGSNSACLFLSLNFLLSWSTDRGN
jgi:hypothetical protein